MAFEIFTAWRTFESLYRRLLRFCGLVACNLYQEEDTCVSYEEEDTCVSYQEEDT
jgi:hypothetical protein